MKLTERQRGWILWGSRFLLVGVVLGATSFLPEAWHAPVIFACGAVFMVCWVALGASSVLDGGTAKSVRSPKGYRGLDLKGEEPGRADRAP